MRISSSVLAQQAVDSMLSQQVAIATTQNQITSGQRMQTAADDPVAWAQVMGLNDASAATANYQANVTTVTQRLNLETSTLNSVTDLLSSVSQLAIQANSPTLNAQDRQNIATQLTQLKQQLLGYANTQDSGGHYIFAGSASSVAPFSSASAGVSYNGNQAQRTVTIGQNRSVADGDSGSSVFMSARSGNGTFAVSAAGANAGSAALTGTNVIDSSLWDGGQYNVSFNSGNYQVTDAGNNVVASGAYAAGSAVRFRGVEVTFSGAPANGDSFGIGPSQAKDVFSTIQDLITAVKSPQTTPAQIAQSRTSLFGAQQALSNAYDQVNTINSTVGSRLIAVNSASVSLSQQSVDVQQAVTNLAGTDLARAASQLSLQSTVLQATQLAFTKVQGLSLFNYIK
jgi:flagellar hook-associated protein 3 FlgL